MSSKDRWQIEEAHDSNVRALNEAEEILNTYRQQLYQESSHLLDYVYNFYRELPNGQCHTFSYQFEQTTEEYNWQIRKKQQEIEEARDQERRDFNRKMDE